MDNKEDILNSKQEPPPIPHIKTPLEILTKSYNDYENISKHLNSLVACNNYYVFGIKFIEIINNLLAYFKNCQQEIEIDYKNKQRNGIMFNICDVMLFYNNIGWITDYVNKLLNNFINAIVPNIRNLYVEGHADNCGYFHYETHTPAILYNNNILKNTQKIVENLYTLTNDMEILKNYSCKDKDDYITLFREIDVYCSQIISGSCFFILNKQFNIPNIQ